MFIDHVSENTLYTYTCSFIVHIFTPFVDLSIIHHMFIAYSTLNTVSLYKQCICLLILFIYLFIF